MARTWVDVQKRTFTGWANNFLKERILKINDIETDLEDGVNLINLLEIISSKTLGRYNKTPRGRFQKIENNGFAVKFIASEGLKLVGIGAEDIVDGKIKLILGLIWTLILRYQIQMISAAGDDSPKQALLAWVKKQIESYGVPVDNFDKSWQDGRALAALTDSLKKGCMPLSSLSGDAVNDINKAMDISEASFEIPKIMDPSDLANIPDELSVMTYVSYFRDYASNREKLMAEEHAAEQERKKLRADPTFCYAEGPGLEGGFNNEPAMFTIHAKNFFDEPLAHGGEQFVIEVVNEHGQPTQAQITDKKDGTYNAAYMPETPGKYTVKVTLGGTSIKNLPVTVEIEGSDPAHSYAEGPGLTRADVGKPAHFTVHAKNSKGEPLKRGAEPFTVWISKGESGESEVQVDIKDNEDGTYSVEYQPLEAGPKVIHIQLRDKYITDAPFKLNSFGATPENSYAEGPGLEKGQALKPAHFTIHGIGADGAPFKSDENHFTVAIEGPHPTTADVKSNGDGTFAVTYTPTEPGDYKVNVNLFGHPIKNTPVTVHFKPAVDATHTSIENLKPGQAEVPQSFKIVAKDPKGNPRTDGGDIFLVDLVGPGGNKLPGVQVEDNGDGTYDVKFTPTEPGDYDVKVLVGGETPLANNTNLHIKPAPSATNSYAEGPGLDSGKVYDNEPAKFKIHAVDPKGQPRQDGGDAFHVDIIAPHGAPAVKADVHDNGDGTYDVTYEPTVAGDYKVEVKLDHPTGHQNHIKNSPHSVTVREGTDGSLSAFGKFTITIVAHDKQKKPKTFGGDPFEVSIKGPAEQIAINAIDNQDGTYTAAYALVGSGRFDVEVKLNGKNIEGSPFKQVLGSGKRDKSVAVHTSTARAN